MSIGDLITSPNWGSVPDWVGAIGTISAVGVALRLAHRDGKRLDEERHEAKADREEAARERALFREQQAAEAEERKRRLAAQVTLIAETSYSANKPQNGFEGRAVSWSVYNGGDQPISMVTLVQRELDLATGAETGMVYVAKKWNVIEAGGSRQVLTQLNERIFYPMREVQFIDGAGVRWQRQSHGSLRLLEDDDPQAVQLHVPA